MAGMARKNHNRDFVHRPCIVCHRDLYVLRQGAQLCAECRRVKMLAPKRTEKHLSPVEVASSLEQAVANECRMPWERL